MSWRTSARFAAGGTLVVVLLAVGATEARGTPGGWTWPVEGRVITPYSNDNSQPYAGGMHRGIDIAAPVGTPVRAAHGGEVTYAGPLGSAGLTVALIALVGSGMPSTGVPEDAGRLDRLHARLADGALDRIVPLLSTAHARATQIIAGSGGHDAALVVPSSTRPT